LILFIFTVLIVATSNTSAEGLSKYPFVNLTEIRVNNDSALIVFFAKLAKLQKNELNSKINIVHIGDSHIQGDFLTGETRKLFQQNFGNGGRGLIFPYRLAGSYESNDFHSASDNLWSRAAIISSKRVFEPGLSGLSIRPIDSKASLTLTTNNHDTLDYSFDNIKLICRNNDSARVQTSFSDSKNDINKLVLVEKDNSYDVELGSSTNQIRFTTNQKLTIDGFVLEKNLPGILYHVIGVTGAHYANYSHAPVFFEQLSVLKPDVILISQGTNEGVNTSITKAGLIIQIEKMVHNIQHSNPGIPVVLVTPFDSYFKKNTFNKYLGIVRSAVLEVAQRNNLAYIDCYQITGGWGSAKYWRKYELLRPDGIHYTKQGYALQGEIIYHAFINSYLKYATH
jgi:hypothetical protein